jgi:hypothetical protein
METIRKLLREPVRSVFTGKEIRYRGWSTKPSLLFPNRPRRASSLDSLSTKVISIIIRRRTDNSIQLAMLEIKDLELKTSILIGRQKAAKKPKDRSNFRVDESRVEERKVMIQFLCVVRKTKSI